MAEVSTEGKGGDGKGKQKKKPTRVDFTPMVDLGFLLITFFMLTTSMLKPQTMEIAMPSKDKLVDDSEINKVKASTAVTVILGKEDKVFYYFGLPDADNPPEVIETDFAPAGVRTMLLQRNSDVVSKIIDLKKDKEAKKINDEDFKKKASEIKEDKAAPVVMIKASDKSSYKNLVDILDEMQICNIGRYAIVDITPYDTMVVYNKLNPNAIQTQTK